MQDWFFLYRTNLRKERSSIRSYFDGGRGQDGVKDQDERQKSGALDTAQASTGEPLRKVT
jgi:hypothetical protein